MTDITLFDEIEQLDPNAAPPLCLVHYFGTDAAYPPNPKPPGDALIGEIAEPSETEPRKALCESP